MYGPLTPERSRTLRLDLPNIDLQGFTCSTAMRRSFQNKAHALLIPQSFLNCDRRQSVMSFPSKIADYTAVGLPLLILAPEYSSLVQWAKQIKGIAEIVTLEDAGAVKAAIERLMSSPHERRRYGLVSLEAHMK